MRAMTMCTLLAVPAMAGCLRGTQFKCLQDFDCGAGGACEANGFCSVPNADCTGTGRAYSDSAGQGLSGSCVPTSGPGPGRDAGVDGPIDGTSVGCPSGYNPVGGSTHRYKLLTNVSWDTAASDCHLTSAAAYLAVPDNAGELADLATVATTPFWIGLNDPGGQGNFVSQKGGPAMFTPWAADEPNEDGGQHCVIAVSAMQIAADKCGTRHNAVCECEPGS